MSRASRRAVALAVAVATGLVGCGSVRQPANASRVAAHHTPGTGIGGRPGVNFPATFVGARGHCNLGLFSSVDARQVRCLTRTVGAYPVAFGPGGRSVYYTTLPEGVSAGCPLGGFKEPRLWRVRIDGGRPHPAGLRTTNLAFSPDGRMLAYLATPDCGRTLQVVVRNLRTGAWRRFILLHNVLTSDGVVDWAGLSWSSDDTHLAVVTTPAAAINDLGVINALRVTDASYAGVSPCSQAPTGPDRSSAQIGCLYASYDNHARLTFYKWWDWVSGGVGQGLAWMVRWVHGRTRTLFRFTNPQNPNAGFVSIDHAGNAVIWNAGEWPRTDTLYRWSDGHVTRVCHGWSCPSAQLWW